MLLSAKYYISIYIYIYNIGTISLSMNRGIIIYTIDRLLKLIMFHIISFIKTLLGANKGFS